MNPLDRLLIGSILVVGALFTGVLGLKHYGAERYDAGHAAAIAERAQADAKAVRTRITDNTALAAKQAASNATITEQKHEEIQPVRERIVTQRVYVGPAVCGDGPPATAEAQGAGSGDGTDSPGRLVRPDVERDLVALKLAVEEDLATGRACQAVLKSEGMVP
jgi:prophage endopeptidase